MSKGLTRPGGYDDRAPAGPPDPPQELVVEAPTRDLLRQAVRNAVEAEGLQLRSVSFGPDGLVVYAEEAK